MELTSHEQKILDIVNNHPEVLGNPEKRTQIAELYGLSEKTLRNRIAELKKYGFIGSNSKVIKSERKHLITENDEINLAAILDIIKLEKIYILKLTLFFTMIGLIYSLLATLYFKSTISMYPAGELSQSGGVLGEFQGLAKTFGMGSLGPAPTYNIPDIINSRRLKKDIVQKIWKTQNFPEGSNLVTFWELDNPKFFSPRKWLSKFLPKGNFIADSNAKLIHEAILDLDDLITVREEISGLITVSILMQDPTLAANIANYIANYVKDFISYEQHREAQRNRKFVEDQKSDAKIQLEWSEEQLTSFRKKHPIPRDTPQLQMQRSRLESGIEENRAVYITIRQQYEIAKIEAEKDRILVNLLDVGEPAVKETKPKRLLILAICFTISLVANILFILYNADLQNED